MEHADALRRCVRGPVWSPKDAAYDERRRVWNRVVDRRPACIVECRDVDDVIATVRFAAEHSLAVSQRAGGHGLSGAAIVDGAILVDLRALKRIDVFPERARASAESGVLWSELDAATGTFGLATPGPAVGAVGIAGSTLGGGFGWISRKHGLSLDNLIAADIVLADGRLVTASADAHADLFWAIRGAGASFGIATRLEYALHPVARVAAGGIVYPQHHTKDVLQFFREFRDIQPDELTTWIILERLADGTPVCTIHPCWCGDLDDVEAELRPLLGIGAPLRHNLEIRSYVEQQRAFSIDVEPVRTIWASRFLDPFNDAAIDAVAGGFVDLPTPASRINLEDYGGAIRLVPRDATAFPFRDGCPLAVFVAEWKDAADDRRCIERTLEVLARLDDGTAPLNVTSHIADARALARAHGGDARVARLSAIKRIYDPTNVFRSPIGIGV
jgi:FAD/FMN-containing dehydrogenase